MVVSYAIGEIYARFGVRLGFIKDTMYCIQGMYALHITILLYYVGLLLVTIKIWNQPKSGPCSEPFCQCWSVLDCDQQEGQEFRMGGINHR